MNEVGLILLAAYGGISIVINLFYLFMVGNQENIFETAKDYYTVPIDILTNELNLNKFGVAIAMIVFQVIMLCGEVAFFSMLYLVYYPIGMICKLFCKIFQRHDKEE